MVHFKSKTSLPNSKATRQVGSVVKQLQTMEILLPRGSRSFSALMCTSYFLFYKLEWGQTLVSFDSSSQKCHGCKTIILLSKITKIACFKWFRAQKSCISLWNPFFCQKISAIRTYQILLNDIPRQTAFTYGPSLSVI